MSRCFEKGASLPKRALVCASLALLRRHSALAFLRQCILSAGPVGYGDICKLYSVSTPLSLLWRLSYSYRDAGTQTSDHRQCHCTQNQLITKSTVTKKHCTQNQAEKTSECAPRGGRRGRGFWAEEDVRVRAFFLTFCRISWPNFLLQFPSAGIGTWPIPEKL